MTDLPRGWAYASLAELVDVNVRGFDSEPGDDEYVSLVPMASVEAETGRMDPSQEVRYGEAKKRSLTSFREGDVLFAKVTPCMENGKIAVARNLIGGRGLGSTEFFALRSRGAIEPDYLALFLLQDSVRKEAQRHMTGAVGLRRVPRAYLENLRIPIPPLAEQRRIVSALEGHLSRLTSANAQLRAAERRLGRFHDQIMQLASTGGFVSRNIEECDLKRLPNVGVQDGELPATPPGWIWRRLGEIADIVGGVAKDSKRQSDPSFVEVPYLRVANVQRGRLDLDDVARIRVPVKKAEQLRLQRGDVLLNEGGDRDKLGRGWIWEDQIPGCIHQNHVFRVRLHEGTLHPKLLAWHANGFGRRWFQANGLQSVNLASISLGKMKLFPVPVPPLEQQAELVATAEKYLSLLDKLASAVAEARHKAKHLRASLLAEAFAGRLVPQDPNDEPASELLARIRADRAAAVPAKRARAARGARTRKELPAPPTRVTGDNYEQGALPL